MRYLFGRMVYKIIIVGFPHMSSQIECVKYQDRVAPVNNILLSAFLLPTLKFIHDTFFYTMS